MSVVLGGPERGVQRRRELGRSPRESEFLLRGIRLRLMVKCLLTVDIRSLRLRLCRRIFLERTYHGSNHDKHGYSQRWLQRRQSAWREGGRRSAGSASGYGQDRREGDRAGGPPQWNRSPCNQQRRRQRDLRRRVG